MHWTCTGQNCLVSSVSVVPSCTVHLRQPAAIVNAASLQLICLLLLQMPSELCAVAASGTDPLLHHASALQLPHYKYTILWHPHPSAEKWECHNASAMATRRLRGCNSCCGSLPVPVTKHACCQCLVRQDQGEQMLLWSCNESWTLSYMVTVSFRSQDVVFDVCYAVHHDVVIDPVANRFCSTVIKLARKYPQRTNIPVCITAVPT